MALLNSNDSCVRPTNGTSRKHLCSVYRDESDQASAYVPFLLEGLRRNDRCLYVSDGLEKEAVFDRLMSAAPVTKELLDARITFLSSDEVYLKGGEFDRERMLMFLSEARDESLRAGFAGLTGTGEMGWATRGAPGASELIEYEAQVNLMYPESSSDILCQYPESDFDPATLVNAIRAHPQVIVRGNVCGNPYYLPPDVLIPYVSGFVTSDVLDRMEKEMFSRSVLSEISSLESKDLRRASLCLNVLDCMVLEDFRDRLSAASFFHELALDACEDGEVARHVRSAAAKCVELADRLDALRAFRACLEAPTQWQSLEEVVSKALDMAVGSSRKASAEVGAYRILVSTSSDKALSAFVAAVAERSPGSSVIDIRAEPSEFGLTIRVGADGPGVPEGAKEALFDMAGPCICGRSLFLAKELLESNGVVVREVGIPGKSVAFEIHVPASGFS